MPENAHPDSNFSSHLHNDWWYTQKSAGKDASLIQLNSKEYPGQNMQKLAQGYEGMFREDKRMFPEFEDQGDYIQIKNKEYPGKNI